MNADPQRLTDTELNKALAVTITDENKDEIDALYIEWQRRNGTRTVKLTRAQFEFLDYLLPLSKFGLSLLPSRVRGDRVSLRAAADYVDADDAIQMRAEQRQVDITPALEGRIEANIRMSCANLKRKLRGA